MIFIRRDPMGDPPLSEGEVAAVSAFVAMLGARDAARELGVHKETIEAIVDRSRPHRRPTRIALRVRLYRKWPGRGGDA